MARSSKLSRILVTLTLLGLPLAGVGGLFVALQTGLLSSGQTQPRENSDLPATPVSRPAPPPEGYVGSQVCQKCHSSICDTFAQHPMGKSAALTPGPADIEDFSPARSEFTAVNGNRYRVVKTQGGVRHYEIGQDRNGRVLYEQSALVSLALGSGIRGKSYGINNDGFITQSPISWYAPKGGYFELSPGYELPGEQLRFERTWIEGCIVCHTGRVEFDPEVPNRLAPPYFHELAIGCERCHGPAKEHVRRQEAAAAPSPDDSIVNPARLPMREREAVCYQCHLHGTYRGLRYGRNSRDFRPGMKLEDVFCILVQEEKSTAAGSSKAVSQVEQMWSSACFKGSGGKLGCISCHDPHAAPVDRERHFRAQCQNCHAERGCSADAAIRAQRNDSCIECHMPKATARDIIHAAQTDHRILRDPPPQQIPDGGAGEMPPELEFFDSADQRMPRWEVQRTRGLALIFLGNRAGRPREPEEIPSLLVPLTKIAPDDEPLLAALGSYYLQQQQYSQAKDWLEKSIASLPKNEVTLAKLTQACFLLGDLPKAKTYIERAIAVNPHRPGYYVLLAEILSALGDDQGALRAADKAFELDPTKSEVRNRLLGKPRS